MGVLDSAINELSKLPGIGRKTAQRLALFILKSDPDYARRLSESIYLLKTNVHFCKQCFNISEGELCSICANPQRDQSKICVVEDIVDILAIESANEYDGLYHVLGGVISPLSGVMASDLKLQELLNRLQDHTIRELLLALNPSTEGEATMIYISRKIERKDLRITRIASGIPIGSHLEFVDKATIGRAILGRQDL